MSQAPSVSSQGPHEEFISEGVERIVSLGGSQPLDPETQETPETQRILEAAASGVIFPEKATDSGQRAVPVREPASAKKSQMSGQATSANIAIPQADGGSRQTMGQVAAQTNGGD